MRHAAMVMHLQVDLALTRARGRYHLVSPVGSILGAEECLSAKGRADEVEGDGLDYQWS